MIPVCRHIKTNGARCKGIALRDRPYCYVHDRLHRVLTKRSSTSTNSFMLHPLEDRNSVFLALSDVICGLAAGQINPENATRLIHGLQAAGKYAPNFSSEVAQDAVKSLDFTTSGDELAPLLSYCTADELANTQEDDSGQENDGDEDGDENEEEETGEADDAAAGANAA